MWVPQRSVEKHNTYSREYWVCHLTILASALDLKVAACARVWRHRDAVVQLSCIRSCSVVKGQSAVIIGQIQKMGQHIFLQTLLTDSGGGGLLRPKAGKRAIAIHPRTMV